MVEVVVEGLIIVYPYYRCICFILVAGDWFSVISFSDLCCNLTNLGSGLSIFAGYDE